MMDGWDETAEELVELGDRLLTEEPRKYWGTRNEMRWLTYTVRHYPTQPRRIQRSRDALAWLQGYKLGLMRRVRGFVDGPMDVETRDKMLKKVRVLEEELKDKLKGGEHEER